MGTRMGPSYANLFLGKFEHDALLRASYKPYLWFRFIDDIFMIWTEGLEKLELFADYFDDNSHSSIKFTCTNSFNNIPFLDVMVSVKDGFIETDLYTKPTDRGKTPVSSHFILLPHHTKRSIRYSLALRLPRICYGHDSYIQRTNELINYLNNRGHDKAFLTRQIQRTSDVPCADALKDKPPTRTETTPFVIKYNLTLPNVAHIIHKHSHFLYSSERCRNVFKNLPVVSYRRSDNLSDILVRSQLPETG